MEVVEVVEVAEAEVEAEVDRQEVEVETLGGRMTCVVVEGEEAKRARKQPFSHVRAIAQPRGCPSRLLVPLALASHLLRLTHHHESVPAWGKGRSSRRSS